MLGRGNINNIKAMNIGQQQYQEIEDLEGRTSTPKQKYYYQNALINMNDNNAINNIKKQNNVGNMNSNMKIMNMKGNMKNMNIPRNNNSDINNTDINRALLVIRNEFKRKDDRIKSLELKVAELERKINIIINSNQQDNNKQLNVNNNIQISRNFTFADKNSGEINAINNINNFENKIKDIGVKNFRFDNNINIPQNKSPNKFNINNQYNLEKQYSNNSNNTNNTNNTNLNDKLKENSAFTGNSSNSKVHTKNEVKLYLKEVKSKVEPSIFKEFISNIKLLTSAKEKNGVDRKEIIENVKRLFGEQYKDLFIKFQLIIGVNE